MEPTFPATERVDSVEEMGHDSGGLLGLLVGRVQVSDHRRALFKSRKVTQVWQTGRLLELPDWKTDEVPGTDMSQHWLTSSASNHAVNLETLGDSFFLSLSLSEVVFLTGTREQIQMV